MTGEQEKPAPSQADDADQFDADAEFSKAAAYISGKTDGEEAVTDPVAGNDEEGEKPDPEASAEDDAGPDGGDDQADEKDGAEKDAASGDEDEDDPWKDAPPHLRELFEKERQEREREHHRFKVVRGQLRALNQARLKGSTRSADADDDETRDAERKKLDEAAEQYGDVVGPLVERIRDFDDRFRALDKADQEERETILRFESEAFLEDHPDGFDVVTKNVDAFKSWVQDQPKAVRDGFELNKEQLVDADSASLVVREFKRHLAAAEAGEPSDPPAETRTTTSAKRDAQRRGAQGTRSASPPHTTEPSRNADDPNAVFDWAVKDLRQKGIARA